MLLYRYVRSAIYDSGAIVPCVSTFFFCFLISVFCVASDIKAQTYIPLDTESLIYCSDLPNQDAQVVKYDPVAGIVLGVNPDAVIAEYDDKIRNLKKRRKSLQKLKKREHDKNFLKHFKKNYKLAFGKKFKGGEFKAENALGKVIRRVAREIRLLESILQSILDCEENELESLPSNGSLQFVEFSFTHPDYGYKYYMFGVGVIFNVKPSKKFKPVCYSLGGSGGFNASPVYPEKNTAIPYINPCLAFYPSTFRNIPECSPIGGNVNTRIEWINVNIATRPRTEREVEIFKDKVSDMGPVIFNPYRKKIYCKY